MVKMNGCAAIDSARPFRFLADKAAVAADFHAEKPGLLLFHLCKLQNNIAVLLDAVNRVKLIEALYHARDLYSVFGDGCVFVGCQLLSTFLAQFLCHAAFKSLHS